MTSENEQRGATRGRGGRHSLIGVDGARLMLSIHVLRPCLPNHRLALLGTPAPVHATQDSGSRTPPDLSYSLIILGRLLHVRHCCN